VRFCSERDIQDQADISHGRASQVFEDGNEIQKLVVVRIRKPAADRDGVLGVEYVRRGRVVDDDGVFEVPADLGEILDIVALVVVATFSEEPVVDYLVDVQLIQQRVAILSHC